VQSPLCIGVLPEFVIGIAPIFRGVLGKECAIPEVLAVAARLSEVIYDASCVFRCVLALAFFTASPVSLARVTLISLPDREEYR